METKQAEYKTDIARLAEHIAKRDAKYMEDAAKRDTEAAKRDTEAAKRENKLIITVIAVIGLAVAFLKYLP